MELSFSSIVSLGLGGITSFTKRGRFEFFYYFCISLKSMKSSEIISISLKFSGFALFVYPLL